MQRKTRELRTAERRSTRRTEWLLINPHIAVWGLAFLHWLPAVLSIEAISNLGAWIGRTVGPRTRRHGRAVKNIALAFPDLTRGQQEQIAIGMWENFGRTIAESFIIDKIAAEAGRVVCADATVITQRTGGAIFVGLHFGNWEATVVPAAQLGERPIGVYKPLRSADADAYLRKLRADLYPGGLQPASPATLLRLARHLRDGGSVCMLADHRDLKGIVVPFFGYPAPSPTLPALMALKYGLPVYAARVDRLDNVRFSVHIEKITGSGTDDVTSLTAVIQSTFERWIRARPDQWVWFYNRWEDPQGPGSTQSGLETEGRSTVGEVRP